MSFLKLDNLHKTYPDGTSAVRGVSLDVNAGEFIVLLGPSGCGKTSTLRMIAGLENATQGRITLNGRDVTHLPPGERDVGFVFQFYALYPHLSVEENIVFPLRAIGMNPSEVASRLRDIVERVGLAPLLKRRPRELSGGDQQRVSLARAMIRKPLAWLMDEPLGTLDADRRLALREFIRQQQLDMRVTTLYVTHDQEEAMSLADRLVVMNGGRVQQVGTPAEVYDKPANLFVANFVGSPGMNFIKGNVAVYGETSHFIPYGEASPIRLSQRIKPGAVTLGIRGEHVHPDPGGPVVGKVLMVEYLGSSRSVHVEATFGRLIFRDEPTAAHTVGQSLRLSFDPAHVNLFDGHSGSRVA